MGTGACSADDLRKIPQARSQDLQGCPVGFNHGCHLRHQSDAVSKLTRGPVPVVDKPHSIANPDHMDYNIKSNTITRLENRSSTSSAVASAQREVNTPPRREVGLKQYRS
jgi:hypothetical protein